MAAGLAKEVRWLEAADERLLVTLILILDTDGEFSGVLLARDLQERYRWVDMTDYFMSPDEALAAAGQKVTELVPMLDAKRAQGDERSPIDFFDRCGRLKG
jgi:hypothetical protein